MLSRKPYDPVTGQLVALEMDGGLLGLDPLFDQLAHLIEKLSNLWLPWMAWIRSNMGQIRELSQMVDHLGVRTI